ncbi:MAG: PHA/PHB synthase family protein [Notoacmeibacter sp.]
MSDDKNGTQKAAPFAVPDASELERFMVKDPDAFAMNMAKMVEQAGHAASAWVKPRETGEKSDTVSEPVADMVKTFSKVTEYWLADPSRALEAQTQLFSRYMGVWTDSLKKLGGQEVGPEPGAGDKRFADEDWSKQAFFSFLKQTYVVTSDWAESLVKNADGLEPHIRHKAEFYARQIASALSPSNFVLTNPELLRETVSSNGENLVRGVKMLAEDIAAGGGDLRLRQTDTTRFKVGVDLATTPGKVIARSEVAEIIQYEPSTPDVLKRPLLICPPWINKFYILDLTQEKSFIKWCVDQGITVFVISWVNPSTPHAHMGWEAYVRDGLQCALNAVEAETGEKQVNAIGYCVGGTLLAAAMALFAQEGEKRIKSATLFTTQVDFTHAGDLKVFVDEDQIGAIEASMEGKGYLDGTKMASAFNMLRSSELIWPYVVNNYIKGKAPTAFDLLFWNADSTRMSAANHSYYLRNCYLENTLAKGTMQLAGKTLNLADIKVPIFNLAAKEDHIAPALSAFEGSKLFGGDVRYVLSGSGHIAGVVNPPAKKKYQYWTGYKPEGTYEDWFASATETPGSWWPFWLEWIKSLDAATVKARPAGKNNGSLENAPGSYVLVRV